MKRPLRILHLEDDRNDAELIQAALEADGFACKTTRVETSRDFEAEIERSGSIDLILADVLLPKFDGLAALRIALTKCPGVPFIFVSGTFAEDLATETLGNGAADYVLKTDLVRLGPAVRRAVGWS